MENSTSGSHEEASECELVVTVCAEDVLHLFAEDPHVSAMEDQQYLSFNETDRAQRTQGRN